MPLAPNHVLYLRPDSTAELVVFSAALGQLLRAWPESRHTVFVRAEHAGLAPLFPRSLGWRTLKTEAAGSAAGGAANAVEELLAELEKDPPDLVVAFGRETTAQEVSIASRFPKARRVAVGRHVRAGGAVEAMRIRRSDTPEAFTEWVATDDRLQCSWDIDHAMVEYLLGLPVERVLPWLLVPSALLEQGRRLITERGLQPGRFIALYVGGVTDAPLKAWPAAKFGELVQWFRQKQELPVLLLAESSEAARLGEVLTRVAQLGGAHVPTWLGRKEDLASVAGLLAHASCFVGNESAALHLAAALGQPVVGIFGGGHWPRCRPVGRQALSVVQTLACFGCQWDCCFGEAPCVKTIPVSSVQRAVETILRSAPASFDHVVQAGGLSPDAVNLIKLLQPRLATLRRGQHGAGMSSAVSSQELAARDEQIALLKAEARAKDRKIVDLVRDLAGLETESALEIERHRLGGAEQEADRAG
jgi:ADP-heptose:LPS heptosyltransferase